MKPLGNPETREEGLAEAALESMPKVDLTAARYARALPGVASPSYHAVESATFDLAIDGGERTMFMKVAAPELAGLIDHKAAFEAARAIHALGHAPEPLHLAEQQGATIFRRLGEDWRAAKIDDLCATGPVQTLIAMQRSIAAGAKFGRDWNVFDGIETLYARLAAIGTRLPSDIDWLLAAMEPMRAAIDAAGFDRMPAHGDPQASNVMIGPNGSLCLVDFDMAADIDPYYSLGVLMNELFQFESEMKPLLEMHDGGYSDTAFNRCRLYAAADDLYWALRGMLLEALSPRRGLEFLKYAEWRFLRCRMLVGRPGFEELIRSM